MLLPTPQGLSYTLSTVALPSLLSLPSASSASHAFTHLTTRALTDLRILAGISTSSFALAYALSPRGARHPYLLWTALFVAASGLTDLVLRPQSTRTIASAREADRARAASQGPRRALDASYEVLGDSHSEGQGSASESDEDVNGEEIRAAVEQFRLGQTVRAAVSGIGFAMSVVGIWGDGYRGYAAV